MQSNSFEWDEKRGLQWGRVQADFQPQLILFFAPRDVLLQGSLLSVLRRRYPQSQIVGSTGAGFFSRSLIDEGVALGIGVQFQHSYSKVAFTPIADSAESAIAGAALAQALNHTDLKAVFILSEGATLNGTHFLTGLSRFLPPHVKVIGGLAGGYDPNYSALFVLEDGALKQGYIIAIGFYGAALDAKTGTGAGWIPIGVKREITRSHQNIVYELGGQPALDVYLRYLGPDAENLDTRTTLKFPFQVTLPHSAGNSLIRAVRDIDHDARSLIFSGDMGEGWIAQLVRNSFERMAEGARQAAACGEADNGSQSLALFVSCIGRRWFMGQRIIDEIGAIEETLPPQATIAGFYSYGEFAPDPKSQTVLLQNETITMLNLRERVA